jgi:flagellar biosynthesis protein FlhB
VLLAALGPWLAQEALQLVATGLRFDREAAFEPARMVPRLAGLGVAGIGWLVPLLAGIAVVLTAATLAVGGWNFTTQALEPKFERLNPISGFGRIFSGKQLLSSLRLIVLAAALLGTAGWYLWDHAGEIGGLSQLSLAGQLSTGFGWLYGGLAMLLGITVVSTIADVPMQIFKHKSELKMTREEAKQENKESEGDPHVKGERRRRARELSRGRMMAAVPQATVVVTNPTHYAVALQYDDQTMAAPRIVAMGTDLLALKIREIAAASGVPTLEAPPLARALYKHGDIDRDIPVQLYTAVAQVLAWVMRLSVHKRRPPEPVIEVPAGMDPLEGQQ